jgi:uncharacterized protein YndB with AHSA1/START domain
VSRRFELRREVMLPASPDEVWRAIATPEGQAGWFMTSPDDPDAETVEEVDTGEGGDRERRLKIRSGTHAMEYVIQAASGATTVLRLVHSGILGDDWGDEFETMTGLGWDQYLFTLGEYLRHFPGRPAVYGAAEAPARPGAWQRVLAALDDPATGDTVRLPVGPGVVDLRSDHYLGVRTPNALVRFHERSLLGMPVAVGHHDHTSGADPHRLAATWSGWLAEVAAR